MKINHNLVPVMSFALLVGCGGGGGANTVVQGDLTGPIPLDLQKQTSFGAHGIARPDASKLLKPLEQLVSLETAGLVARWTETPGHLGLHLLPAAFVLLLLHWSPRIRSSLDAMTAMRWSACLAALNWASLVFVDVGACQVHPSCELTSTGGAGLADMLVLGPLVAFAGSMLVWLVAHRSTGVRGSRVISIRPATNSRV